MPQLWELLTLVGLTLLQKTHGMQEIGLSRGAQEYLVYAGPWSNCEARSSPSPPPGPEGEDQALGHGLTFEPMLGEQSRAVRCRDAYGALVDLSYCASSHEQLPVSRRVCVIHVNCVLSEWSPWHAPPHCAATSALLMRTRTVLQLPQGGNPCGALREYNVTGIEVGQVGPGHWSAGTWGPCRVASDDHDLMLPPLLETESVSTSNLGRCGGGLQRREVSCVSEEGAPLSARLCAPTPPPVPVQRCEVACPRDCVVGEWGLWGPCEPLAGCPMTPVEELTANGYRRRTRRILVAASEEGAPCAALSEVQSCARPACSRWTTGAWAACRLPPGRHCGPGYRQRSVTCTDLKGAPLGEERCLGVSGRPPMQEPCQVACPLDCVLSSWSPWSPCSHACSTRHHMAVRFRNRTIVAPQGEGGHPCPPPEALLQTEPCNTHACHGYSWLALPWQPCGSKIRVPEGDINDKMSANEVDSWNESIAAASMNDEPSEDDVPTRCGEGLVQMREVWCMENNDRQVKDSHCAPMKRPEVWRSCTRECPQPCELSEWSEWTPCPTSCENGSQQRVRTVLRAGTACGALRERRACSSTGGTPHWTHGAWSACGLPEGETCGTGLMTRGVWCSQQHHKVGPTACMLTAPPPASLMRCTVDCNSHCQLSDWSPWSHCKAHCTGVSTRYRKKLGNSLCPKTILYEGHECPCGSFHAQLIGGWSSCIVSSPLDAEEDIGDEIQPRSVTCGTGARYRRVACLDAAGRAVEPRWCKAHLEGLEEDSPLEGLVRESCVSTCPVDCRMSQWSAWGPCSGSPCGVGLQNRTRNILVNASSGGRPCGLTVQVKVCSKPCEQFAWQTGGWGACQLIPRHRELGCGTGEQFRTVRCVELSTGGAVADALCDPLQQPADLFACHLPCPGECVVSDWSEWSQCPAECPERTQRDRTRVLLRGALRGTPSRCPPLVQAQPCKLNRTCFTHAWRISQWGACLPLGGSPCGEGLQQRAIYCERSDGRQVNVSLCNAESRPLEPTETFCYVDCPIDCEVSEWSPWDTSRCSCGLHSSSRPTNYISRYRAVLSEPSSSGRPCPRPLLQLLPCPLTPCYTLHKSPFTHCQLDGASCGYGTRYRNVTCVRDSDGQEVPRQYCSPHLSSPEDVLQEEGCFVDCNDECRHSPWSSWSACDTEGVRYRKRVSFKPPGPPCQENVLRYEVFEYANCNVTEAELNKDISDWSNYEETSDTQEIEEEKRPEAAGKEQDREREDEEDTETEQDDYYVHGDHQPEKTYLLFTGKKIHEEHTALAFAIAAASLAIVLSLLYATFRCHSKRTIHKV